MENYIPALKAYLRAKQEGFQAGQIKTKLNNWKRMTSDPEVLETVKGLKIKFDGNPMTCSQKEQRYFSENENRAVDEEIEKLLKKKVIQKSCPETGQVVSPIFVREKKDGSHRMILNLKDLNQQVEYQKFKMETVQTALQLTTKNCYFASVDLRDAYYSIEIHTEFRKYLKFYWRDTLYCFQAAAMGLAPVPRKFTKLTKPILAHLHDLCHVITSFIDDSLLIGQTKAEIYESVIDTVKVFDSLGFTIHDEKSQLMPTQEITYLGFVINSQTMTITLTHERKQKLLNACACLLEKTEEKIRTVASCIGLMVASFVAVPLGPLYYRVLEKDKNRALSKNKGNWERKMLVSEESKNELRWWVENTEEQSAPIYRPNPIITMKTDSSLTGWGALIAGTEKQTKGLWTEEEKRYHINYLELLAVFLGLKALLNQVTDSHIRIMTDNTTTVSCLNKMGSKSAVLNDLTCTLWKWCAERKLWLSAAHIPGVANVEADKLSRDLHFDTEWKLNSQLLKEALTVLETQPTVDLFASRTNAQFPLYVSYLPDPGAYAVDAFSLHRGDLTFYCFPPFSILPRVLRKIREERVTGIVVAPLWKNQAFWPMLMNMLTARPVRLSAREELLSQPCNKNLKHPLRRKLALLVCKVSGTDSEVKDFLRTQPSSSCHPGENPLNKCMMSTSDSGCGMHVKRKWISFHRL